MVIGAISRRPQARRALQHVAVAHPSHVHEGRLVNVSAVDGGLSAKWWQ